jgi:hypothetical protein
MSKLTRARKQHQAARALAHASLHLLWVGLMLVLPGCQGENGTAPSETNDLPDAGVNAGTDGGDDTRPDAGVDAGTPWITLMSRDWIAMPGATNLYRCRTIQVENELYITGFRSTMPVGQYRVFLEVTDSPLSTGDHDCAANQLAFGRMIYASGMGTDSFAFPSGIAVRVKAHQYITLTLHLSNPSDTILLGTSGVEVQLGSPVSADHEAGLTFAGKIGFSIPPNGQLYSITGGCTAQRDFKVFALWPTMNGIGVRQQLKWSRASVSNTVLDEGYDVHRQIVYPRSVDVKAGDQIQTICDYRNQTDHAVNFGDGSDKELCFTGMYHYPAQQSAFGCVN